ncbi:MAG: hypothetical protein K2O33_00715, partial [Muribaculaceae bacterium]|nr:hypothetical protein [Muribaculaceae bacterium]
MWLKRVSKLYREFNQQDSIAPPSNVEFDANIVQNTPLSRHERLLINKYRQAGAKSPPSSLTQRDPPHGPAKWK